MSKAIKAGVIGWPVSHSRSPLIHQYWLKTYGIDGSYEKIAVEPDKLAHFIATFGDQNFAGVNVTVPHKEAVFKLAGHITQEARLIGAVNTLWFEDGTLIGGNTDGEGFINHLTASSHWRPTSPVAILGAGGAARAIVYGLSQKSVPEIRLINRTRERAEHLAQNMIKHFADKNTIIKLKTGLTAQVPSQIVIYWSTAQLLV